ncbi:MAG: hypothetical protein NTW56_02230 [Alphaproteobacteria bacterium]|nr:hypothetical protein [Alphaproteobacteria bacterium]
MSDSPLPTLDGFVRGNYQPTTFLDRGVSLPFTTPLLVGARMRLAERDGVELIIPNPSGGRGFYIVPWIAMPDICSPTLHDRRLWGLLAEEPVATPEAVRIATRRVMSEGYAGRAAAAAATAADGNRAADRTRANFLMLLRLIERTESPEESVVPPLRDAPQKLEWRAKRSLARAVPLLGLESDDIATCMEEVAGALQDVGIAGDPKPARARRQITEIETLVREVSAWAADTPAAQDSAVAAVIVEAARLTLDCCARVMADLDSKFGDILILLRQWVRDPAPLRQLLARPDWLLDGWSMICGMWRDAPEEARLSISRDIAMLVPVLPREAETWSGISAEWDRPVLLRRKVRTLEDWRTGRIVGITEVRERALALEP